MPKGSIVFISDFSDYGSDTAIRQVLQRLTKSQFIIRLSQGIYYYPKTDNMIGIVYPSAEQIAEAIKNRDHARIIPTGSYASYTLGLSTQLPMNVVYLTDGSPRKIQVGKQKITFRKTSPKNLAVKHNLTSLIIQGLKELGEENIEPHHLNEIKAIIEKSEEAEKVKENIKYAPVWVQKLVLKILNRIKNE
ncbi:MAG: DUF6088 family protein [Bacteroidales bacterium]|nr:DUF6088 family protein [Bacteroidales bacterium]